MAVTAFADELKRARSTVRAARVQALLASRPRDPRREHALLVGHNIRRLRQGRGLSQGQLAAMLDIERPHLSDWERGVHEPGPRSLARIAELLHAGWQDFYGPPAHW
jgi:DNA-binding transcriptional regulator YiaG